MVGNRGMFVRELWESGEYRRMLSKIDNLQRLYDEVGRFFKKNSNESIFERIPNTHYKGSKSFSGRMAIFIKDIDIFIDRYNEGKEEVESVWNSICHDCYNVRGDCSRCFYKNHLESLEECDIKKHVVMLLDKYGVPK